MLYGRRGELERISAVLAVAVAAAGGERRGASLVVRGEPGIGKTALLQAARQRAQGMRVLSTRGVDLDAEIPFAGLFDLFRSQSVLKAVDELPSMQRAALRTALGLDEASVPAGGSPPGALTDRFAIGTATLALLSAAAEQQPLLLIIDDAQWLDGASADALLFAARRLQLDPVVFLWAVREETTSRGPDVSDFETIRLGALDDAAARRLVSESGGRDVAPDVLRHLLTATGGNPLTLVEAVRSLSEAQLGGLDVIPLWSPLGVSAVEIFQDRIDALDPDEVRALTLLSLDSTGEPVLLARAVAVLGIDYRHALARLEADALVRIELGRPTLAHPLVRPALSRRVDSAATRAAHRALAATLTARADPTARAWHLAAAAAEPDESVAAALQSAAEIAEGRSAYATAAVAFERAAGLSPDDPRRADRLLRAAAAARHAGRPDDAIRLLRDAANCATNPAMRALIDGERARVEFHRGGVRTARQLFETAADGIREQNPRQAASLLGQAAVAALMAGEDIRTAQLAQSAHQLAGLPHAGPEPTVELTLGLVTLLHRGATPGALTILRDAAVLAERNQDKIDPDYLAFAALALMWVGEYSRAREMLGRLLPRAREEAAGGLLCPLLYVAAVLEARTGHLIAAHLLATEGFDVSEGTSNNLWCWLSLCVLAYIEAARGGEEKCREHARTAVEMAERLQLDHPALVLHALGLLELGLGNAEQAVSHLEAANRRSGRSEPTYRRPSAPDLVEAYLRAGMPLPAGFGESLEAVSSQHADLSAAAMAWRCRGLLAEDEDLDACFGNALQLHAAADNPFALARTELCYGERLRRAGRRTDAREHLRKARAVFTNLGAAPWITRAVEELRAAGERSHDTAGAGLAVLTAQELQVAFTIVKGVTNREAGAALYLSPKTIEFHLSQIYRKLGIRSRLELAAQVAQHQSPRQG